MIRPGQLFTDRAADYALFRPDYPAEALDAILEGLGEPTRLTAGDVGAGSGIASRLLAERGLRVLAIEPTAEMRQAGTPHPRVEWREGTAERTGLPAASVDHLVCAQAFHWFEPGAALAEFRRVLRPGGRLAVLWNERREDDAFTAAYTQLLKSAARDRTEASRQGVAERLCAGGFDVECLEFDHAQSLTAEGLVGSAKSTSWVPREGPVSEGLVRRLRALHSRFADGAGRVRLLYRTVLYRARLTEAPPP